MTVQELAEEYYKYFEYKERDNGDRFVCLKDDRPEELRDLVYKAHDKMMPDDYKYQYIHDAIEMIADADDDRLEEPEIEPDVYDSDLFDWLSSNLTRQYYVDEAVNDIGHGKSITDDIMYGQVEEKREVYFSVLESLRDITEEMEEDE